MKFVTKTAITGKMDKVPQRRSSHVTLLHLSICFLLQVRTLRAVTVDEVDGLYKHLLTSYNNKLLPLQNQSKTVEVGCFVSLLSMNRFDELSGELDLSMIFNFTWKEERMLWNESEYGEISSLYMAPEDIWRPRLYVRESYDSIFEIGNVSIMVKIASDGTVTWVTGHVIKVTCSVDVTFFPFDSQTCLITLTALPFSKWELSIYTAVSEVNTAYMSNNSQWEYVKGIVLNQTTVYEISYLTVSLTFKRRSEFFFVYVIVPLEFLGVINNLVFFMPVDTGERSSVAVTTFLSFVVFMQIVNSLVPQSSMPIAYIYYYLMFLLLYSSHIMLTVIVTIYIYNKKGPVSRFFTCLFVVLRCRCRRHKQRQFRVKVAPENKSDSENFEVKRKVTRETRADDVTWHDIGRMFDVFTFSFNAIVYFVFSTVIFIILHRNSLVFSSIIQL